MMALFATLAMQKQYESDNPYVYQFIRGLTEGPITKEIAYFKDKA